MVAATATGRGHGSSGNEKVLLNSLKIVAAGTVEDVSPASPISVVTITFPHPLDYGYLEYAILLSCNSNDMIYFDDRTNDSNGKFASFDIYFSGGTATWAVIKTGFLS